MREYPVGSLIYVLQGNGCYPALISEEHTVKTQQGERKKYIINLPGGKSVELKADDSDVFTSVDDARKALMSQAELSIGSHLRKVRELAATLQPDPEVHTVEAEPLADDETIGLVELPDGKVARLKQGKTNS